MINIIDYINESRFKGHDYYRDGAELVEDDKTIAKIHDDGTIEFKPSCTLDEKTRIAMLKYVSKHGPDLNGLYYNDYYIEDGKISKC